MQTTLLTLAIAIILALVAALVAPFYIDWGTYRSLFENEASRLTGVEVHVRGEIDARLLPSPRLQLHDITIGQGDAARARALEVEFGLGQLMRGEWRASELRLVGPQLRVGLDQSGALSGPAVALTVDPDALSIDRLSIEDGSVVLSDAASGSTLALDKLWFNGELRSLAGPLKGEGAANVNGAQYPFRISSGRAGPDGAIRLHLNVDPVETALNIETDGTLSFASGKPQFEGTWGLSRPVGIAAKSAGNRVTQPLITQPWRLTGKIKATPSSALMEQIDFQYGSEVQAVKLNGTANFRFGAQPRFDAVMSASQIDLDRLAGEDEAAHTPPAVILRRFAGALGSAFKLPFPIGIGVGIDAVTLGGSELQSLRGDIASAPGGWALERFEFRAPGLSQVRLSGKLVFTGHNAEFSGPAEVAAGDPSALAAWLEGRKETKDSAATPRPLRLRGEVTLGAERIAVERLDANFDRGAIAGRFRYDFATPSRGARIDAALNAQELDLDAANAFVTALSAGSTLERPSEVKLALDVGRARLAGIDAGKTKARLQYDGKGVKIDELAIDNLGGANLTARGEVGIDPARGALTLAVDARDLGGVTALLARYAPRVAERLRGVAPLLAPAKLTASLKLDNDKGGGHAVVTVNGTAGVTRVALNGEANIGFPTLDLASLRVQGQADTADASALAALLGLDRVVAVNKEPGTLRVTMSGNPLRDLAVTTWLSGGGLAASATGTAQLAPGHWPTGAFSLNIERANIAPFVGTSAAQPLAMTARVTLANDEAAIDEISAVFGGSKLRGRMTASLSAPSRIGGELKADTLDAGVLIAVAAGIPAPAGPWNWPTTPVGGGLLGKINGQISFEALRANIATVTAREFRAQFRLGANDIALENMSGTVAGGPMKGQIAFTSGADGLSARAQIALSGADAEALFPDSARPPITGRLELKADLEGAGRSPVALIGSLHGSGKIALSNGQLAGLDPRVFTTVTQAVDRGLPADASRVSELAGNALQSGQLKIKSLQADLDISAGQVRLANSSASGEGADVALTGGLDLTNGRLNARLVLTGADAVAGARPDIFIALRGALDAPVKSVDVSALTSWLTLRAIDRQSKRLEQIEAQPPPKPTPLPEPTVPPAASISNPPAVTVPPRAPALPAPINILPPPATGGAAPMR